jgi:hypothetical protein
MPLRFTAWLAKFTDIVNLGKLIVDGGPGALLAVAMVMILCHLADVPVLPFGERFDAQRVEAGKDVERQRVKIVAREKALKALEARQADDTSRLGTLHAEIEALRSQRSSLELRGLEAATVRYRRLREHEDSLARNEIGPLAASIATAEGEKARLTEDLTALRADLEHLVQRYEGLRALRVENGTDVLNLVLDHLIGLILVGYLVGTLLSPVNRALFINTFDRLVIRFPVAARIIGGAPKPPDPEALANLRRFLTDLRSRLAAAG